MQNTLRKIIGFMRVAECEKLANRYDEHLRKILESYLNNGI